MTKTYVLVPYLHILNSGTKRKEPTDQESLYQQLMKSGIMKYEVHIQTNVCHISNTVNSQKLQGGI